MKFYTKDMCILNGIYDRIKHDRDAEKSKLIFETSPLIKRLLDEGFFKPYGEDKYFNKKPIMEKQIKLTAEKAKSMLGKSTEMDELLKAHFTLEELGLKKDLPKSWSELGMINGWYVADNSEIRTVTKNSNFVDRNIFKTGKQAESALAMAQLSQLMDVYNDGWVPNNVPGHRKEGYFIGENKFLAFKSAEIRDEFLKNFEPLIRKYFML
jgi:hypothetical protein